VTSCLVTRQLVSLVLCLVDHRYDENCQIHCCQQADDTEEDDSLCDYTFLFLIESNLEPLDRLLRSLRLAFQDISKANITYKHEVVHIIEKVLYCVQPILLIVKTEEDVGYVLRDVPSRVRIRKLWTEISQYGFATLYL